MKTIGKTAAQRKADERERRREKGQVLLQFWVSSEDAKILKEYAITLIHKKNNDYNNK